MQNGAKKKKTANKQTSLSFTDTHNSIRERCTSVNDVQKANAGTLFC